MPTSSSFEVSSCDHRAPRQSFCTARQIGRRRKEEGGQYRPIDDPRRGVVDQKPLPCAA